MNNKRICKKLKPLFGTKSIENGRNFIFLENGKIINGNYKVSEELNSISS